MAHAAKIEQNIVSQVFVIPDGIGGDENDAAIEQYLNEIGLEGHYLRTSYNGNIRGTFAGIGYTYDPTLDLFIKPNETTEE